MQAAEMSFRIAAPRPAPRRPFLARVARCAPLTPSTSSRGLGRPSCRTLRSTPTNNGGSTAEEDDTNGTPSPPTGDSEDAPLLPELGPEWELSIEDDDASPIRDAIEKARARQVDATCTREALEAEAQEVAQLAMEAEELLSNADSEVQAAEEEMERLVYGQQQLASSLDTIAEQVAALRTGTLPKVDKEDAGTGSDEALLKAATSATEALESTDDEAWRREELVREAEKLDKVKALVKAAELAVTAKQDELVALQARAADARMAMDRAEQIVSAAMKAAESAVRDELEASTVVSNLEQTLEVTLSKLEQLQEPEKKDAKAKGKEKAKAAKEAEEKVAAALKSKDFSGETITALKSLELEDDEAAGLDKVLEDQAKEEALAAEVLVKATLMTKTKEPSWVVSHMPILLPAAIVTGVLITAFVKYDVVGMMTAAAANVAPLLAKIPPIHVPHEAEGLLETIWLLLTSVLSVPLVCKLLPGGSPVLGFLAGGAIVGPHGLGLISNVVEVKHIAELGVVFLLFNIGLELSLERLQAMSKLVFGLGNAQFLLSTAAIAGSAMILGAHWPIEGPASIILGGAMALSSTAVAMQVLQDRGETGTRHGRATFSVLLLQDLAVVVLLMLVPLLAPQPGGEAIGMATIARALGVAAVKAALCITGIIAGGRMLVRPLYRRISGLANSEIFAALTLLLVLGTSVLTQLAGLSLALGAFLAGLLVAETEYALQVESDIAPYKGLLMGLFFMTVGMEISVGLFMQKWQTVMLSLVMLVAGKVAIMAALGPLFGLSKLASVRSGLLLGPGGEFAFVTFGDAVARGVLPAAVANEMYIMVVLSMALTPYLAALGSKLGKAFESKDMKDMQPTEAEGADLRGHVIIAGFGRVGRIIAQLLSERMIPFVALDVNAERVQAGRALDLPIYFGDAGSPAVLHAVGAHHASCAVITLDTPGANYRSVWALHKHFPDVKTYVRAHDVHHGVNLERAGATAVVPETLEPSLQLAAAVLVHQNVQNDEVSEIIDTFRNRHISELQELSSSSSSSLGYGYTSKSKKDSKAPKKNEEEGDGDAAMQLAISGASG